MCLVALKKKKKILWSLYTDVG